MKKSYIKRFQKFSEQLADLSFEQAYFTSQIGSYKFF